MSNPVLDGLTLWAPDADGLDSNFPVAATPAGTGQSGDLAAELRRIKSEVRGESILKGWERWKGLKPLSGVGNIVFTYVSGISFSVNDDFLNTNRSVAVVGRRVRALITGSTLYGTITASSFSSPTTTVTVTWDAGALDATLTEVQFGVELRSVGGVQNIPYSRTAPVVNQLYRFDGTNMVPDYDVGIKLLTNKTGVALVAGDVVALDAGNNSAVTLADTASTQKQLVVSLDAPANNATGRFIGHGIVATLNVTGTVTRGNYLVKSATTKVAEDSGVGQGDTTNPPVGAFAVALTGSGGGGSVVARLLGSVLSPAVFGVTPTTQASGDVAAEGTSPSSARADHLHGMPTLPFTKAFASTAQTITSAGALTIAHGLGATPILVDWELINTSAEGNYSLNDIYKGSFLDVGGVGRGVSIVVDATNLNIRFGSNANFINIPDKTTGADTQITNSKWKIVFRAFA